MPTFGSNLGGQLGIANETTVGTPVVVTTFTEINSESIETRKNTAQGGGLRAGGSGVQRAARRSLVTSDAGGDVEFYATTKGMCKWVQAMMGSYSTTAVVIASTTAYKQLHNIGVADGHAFTLQKGVPSVDATTNPITFGGGKVTAWELSCAPNALLTLKVTVDFMNSAPTGAGALGLQTASYTSTNIEFAFNDVTVQTFSAYSITSGEWIPTSPTSMGIVRNLSIKGGQPKKTDRWQAGSTQKAEALVNAWQPLTGQIDIDLASMALFGQYTADTSFGIYVNATGPDAGGGNLAQFSCMLPACFLEQGSTPKMSGTDVNTVQYPYTALDDGTNGAMQIKIVSTDTTV